MFRTYKKQSLGGNLVTATRFFATMQKLSDPK
jgi:hypothetical protein